MSFTDDPTSLYSLKTANVKKYPAQAWLTKLQCTVLKQPFYTNLTKSSISWMARIHKRESFDMF